MSALKYIETKQEYYIKFGGKSLTGKKVIYENNRNINSPEKKEYIKKQMLKLGYSEDIIKIKLEEQEKIFHNGKFSKYERPSTVHILTKYITYIEDIIDIGLKPSGIKNPIFGTIPNGEVNANIIKVTNNNYAILFNDGFLHYSKFFSSLLAQIVPQNNRKINIVGSSEIKDIIKNDSNITVDFFNIMNNYIIEGRLNSINLIDKLKPEQELLSSMFSTSIDLFIISHEYAHFMLGHLEELNDNAQNSIQFQSTNEKELEADLFAIELVLFNLHDFSIPKEIAIEAFLFSIKKYMILQNIIILPLILIH